MLLKNGLVRRVMLSDVSLLPTNRHESPPYLSFREPQQPLAAVAYVSETTGLTHVVSENATRACGPPMDMKVPWASSERQDRVKHVPTGNIRVTRDFRESTAKYLLFFTKNKQKADPSRHSG